MDQDRRHAMVVLKDETHLDAVFEALEALGVAYTPFADPDDVLRLGEAEVGEFDLALLGLTYDRTSGAELSWQLRQRSPRLPIVMVVSEIGTWDPDDLHDCGVNLIVDEADDASAIIKELRPLLERLRAHPHTHPEGRQYERLLATVLDGEEVPARLVNGKRLILYENAPMHRLTGGNSGLNCFELWDAGRSCADCVGMAALRHGRRVTRVRRHDDGTKTRVDAVPVKLDDGSDAVVEIIRVTPGET